MKYLLAITVFACLLVFGCSSSLSSRPEAGAGASDVAAAPRVDEDSSADKDASSNSDIRIYADSGVANESGSVSDAEADGVSDATSGDTDLDGESNAKGDGSLDGASDVIGSADAEAGTSCVPAGSFLIAEVDSGYRIEVSDPPEHPCPIGALVCVLVIGEWCFSYHSYAADGTTRVYLLTNEQYALLSGQDPVTGFYGWAEHGEKCTLPDASPFGSDPNCPVFGYLDKE